MALQHYYYNNQLKKYIIQFMNIFYGMQVEVGKRDDQEPQLVSVPVQYGYKDRVVASILSEGTQNKPLRLPTMSAYLNEVRLAPELRRGIGQQRRQTYLPTGGLFPDDIKTIHQLMPIPYRATMELSVYTSNTDQRFQIMEQILMLFDPIVQIQTTDAVFDWTKLTTVELEGVNFDDNYPTGTDRRIMIVNFTFNLPIYISAPANVREEYIRDIYVRLGTIGSSAETGEDVMAEFDTQGVDYEKWFSLEDIILPE